MRTRALRVVVLTCGHHELNGKECLSMKPTRSSSTPDADGDARCPGESVQDVYREDANEPPAFLRETVSTSIGGGALPTNVYTSPDYHRLELERMWSRVWQVACREEDIPEVGDHVVYEIGETSLIVIRSTPDEIRAYHNSCLHRGTLLREDGGRISRIRCPFHSFTWNLNGEVEKITCPWDFPNLTEDDLRLPEARVDEWGGFVFVNLDNDAGALSTYLERVPQDFARWPLEDRFTAAHAGKVLECNWKIAIEAFIEVFHVIGIHPQSLPLFGDANAQYDVWRGQRHTSRMINLSGVASPHTEGSYSEQRILDAAANFGLCEAGAAVPEGARARNVIVSAMRERLGNDLGIDTNGLSDTEILDVIQYHVFPNLVIFGGLGSPLVYRVRPFGDDPNRCYFEVRLLLPVPDGTARPPAAPLVELQANQLWSSVDAFGYFGPILDQDFETMPRVQRGLRASKTRRARLGNYQESRIRLMRQTLDEYVDD